MKTKALVIASSLQEARNVVGRILAFDSQTLPAADSASSSTSEVSWDVATKYYRAQVVFVLAEASSAAAASLWTAETAAETDALLLHSPTRAALDSWAAALANAERPEVVLVLAHASSAPSGESAAEALREWCLDNCAEFVDLDAESAGRDTEGFERAAEALKMHPWPSSSSSSPQQTQAAAAATEAEEEEEEADGGGGVAEALGRLRALRDRAQGLPDEQRRAFALQVAMAFASQFGGDDEEEEEEPSALAAEDAALAREVFSRLSTAAPPHSSS